MSANLKQEERPAVEAKTTTALAVVADAIAEMSKVDAGLTDLRERFGNVVYDMSKPADMERAKQDRLAVRRPRYAVEQIRKGAKAPITALGREVDTEAARITAAILAIEKPIDDAITNEETRRENVRLAKAEAERQRLADINSHIDYIRSLPQKGAGKSSEHAMSVLQEAEALEIGEEFAEFKATADAALVSAVAALKGIHAERVAHEAAQAKLEADRIELAKLREEAAERERTAETERRRVAAEQAETLKKQRDEQAAKDAEAQRQRDAETARHNAQLQAERDEAARVAAVNKAEADRIAAERQAELDEQKRLVDAQQAELQRQQEAIEAAKPKPAIERPSDDAIIAAVATQFGVSRETAVAWIMQLDLS